MNRGGIYRIKNLETGMIYVGQTSTTFAKRWGKHRRDLSAGCHHNTHLQRSYDKHGKDAFEFKALEVIPRGDMSNKEFSDYINEREIILIAEHGTLEDVYNQTDGGGGMLGYAVSAETKAKLSRMNKGKKLSEDHKEKLSKAMKGIKKTNEHKAALSKAQKGKKHTAETIAKMVKARKGRVLSEESKAKISKSLKGHKISKETKAKISASLTGKRRKEIR